MAIATVHLNQTNSTASATTLPTTITSTGAGNCLIVYIGTNATARTVSSVTDNGTHTNTWAKLNGNAAQSQNVEIWYSLNIPASITQVTVNINSTAGIIMVNINEFSGVARASAADRTAIGSGSSTAPNTGLTPPQVSAADLSVACFVHASNSAPSAGPTNSYNALTAVSVSTTNRLDSAYLVLSSGGQTSTAWTITSAGWSAIIATLTPILGERVAQTVLQVAAQPTSNERVAQTVLQVAANTSGNERVSQSVLQVVAPPNYAYSIVASTHTNTGAAAASLTLSKPAGTVSGNLIIATISFAGDPGSVNITPASGFTLAQYASAISTHGAIATYWKYAGGSEPSTYAFSWSGGNQVASGGMLTLAGPTYTNPIGAIANSGSTSTTSSPLTVVLTPQIKYSMILELLAWNGTQTFTAPTGPWSTQWVDNNASGMSMALSIRNWDTGITIQQTGTLSGSPAEYTSASIEIHGLIIGPPNYKTVHKTPATIEAAGLATLTYSPFKPAITLYDRMKRIGFPIGVQTFIKNLLTSVSLLPTLQKTINTTKTATIVTLTATLLKSIITTLISTAVTLIATLTQSLVHAQTLIATPVSIIATLLKSIGKILTSTAVSLTASLLKQIGKILTSAAVSLTATLQKLINKFIVSTAVSTITTVIKSVRMALVSTIVTLITSLIASSGVVLNTTVNLSATLINNVGKFLTAVVNTSSTLLKIIGKFLVTIVNLIASLNKQSTKTLIANAVNTITILLKNVITTLTSTAVILTATLTHTTAVILNTTVDLFVTLAQIVDKILVAIVLLISNITKSLPRILSATIDTIVTLFKNISTTLLASIINITAILIAGPAVTRILTTNIDITATLFKQIIFIMISRIVFIFSFMNSYVSLTLNAIISVSTILTKSIGKIFSTLVHTISSLIGREVPTFVLYMPLSKTLTLYCSLDNSGNGLNLYMDLDPEAKSKVV